MKLKICSLIIALTSISAIAQVGVGTTAPRGALDIQSNNGGLITPQIALTSVTDNTTVRNLQTNGVPVDGTIIWNTATAGTAPNNVTPGYYYWQTNKWIKLGTQLTKDVKTQASTTSLSNVTSEYGACGTLTNLVTNSTSFSIDSATRIVDLVVSGRTGIICNTTLDISINKAGYNTEMSLFLISPSNKVLELCTKNGGSSSTSYTFNVKFDDSAANNITAWPANTNATGSYKPEGTLSSSNGYVPNITTLAGFNGETPNGTWKLVVIDDVGGNNLTFNNAKLNIATNLPVASYKLVAQKSVNTLTSKNIVATSAYSVKTPKEVVQTIITRSNTNITTTTGATLPTGTTIVSVATHNNATGENWINTFNQAVDESLNNNTTYYYQLWVQGAPAATTTANEQYNFIVRTDDKPTN